MPEVKDETNPDNAYPLAEQEGMAMAEVHERLRRARALAGYASSRGAARAFGWNEETYKAHEAGVRGLRQPVARRYADAFRVDIAWLMYGQGKGPKASVQVGEETAKEPSVPQVEMPLAPQPAFAPIIPQPRDQEGRKGPVYGLIVVSEEGEELVRYGEEHAVAWTPLPRSLADVVKAFGVYVVGDSCEPAFHQGDLVWTDPGQPPAKGKGVVVVLADNTATVKIFIGRTKSHYELEQLKPPQRFKIPRARISGVYKIAHTDHS